MGKDIDWQGKVKGILKAELRCQKADCRKLAGRLRQIGMHETGRNIANKISRGGFTAVFLVQCLEAFGIKELRLD